MQVRLSINILFHKTVSFIIGVEDLTTAIPLSQLYCSNDEINFTDSKYFFKKIRWYVCYSVTVKMSGR